MPRPAGHTLLVAVLSVPVLALAACTAAPAPTVTVTEPVASATATAATPSATQPTETAPTQTPTPTQTTPAPSPTPSPTPSTGPGPGPVLRPAAAPEITGAARYRSTLRFTEPTWGPGRVRLAYQWLRGNSPIRNATGTSYRVAGDDIGARITVRITGTKAGSPTLQQLTAPVGPVAPGRLQPTDPVISGSARVGKTLTGRVDPWGPGAVTLGWQWYRDDTKIEKATRETYKVAAADKGHLIKLRIRGTAPNFDAALRYSEPTGKVAGGVLDPTPVPLYSGTAQVGHTLTALPREWGPGDVTLAYQWFRSATDGDVSISGATKVTYKLAPADAGHRLRVRVTGTKTGYAEVRKYSGWTSEIDPGDLKPVTPVIEGVAAKGATLTAKTGTWGPGEVQLAIRWYRSGMLITRATGDTYEPGELDVGQTITVRVIGTRDGYREQIVESAPTDPVIVRERAR